VRRLWEPMERLVERRLDRPAWEFPHFQPLRLRSAR